MRKPKLVFLCLKSIHSKDRFSRGGKGLQIYVTKKNISKINTLNASVKPNLRYWPFSTIST